MKTHYLAAFEQDSNWCSLQILIGMNEKTEAKLYYINSENCIPEEVSEALFIGLGEYVEIFRNCWDQSLTMEQSAKLGALAIKYVELEHVVEGVGVGKNLQPQV
jgi:hypothetical protein